MRTAEGNKVSRFHTVAAGGGQRLQMLRVGACCDILTATACDVVWSWTETE
jgi:hypothetical protein